MHSSQGGYSLAKYVQVEPAHTVTCEIVSALPICVIHSATCMMTYFTVH